MCFLKQYLKSQLIKTTDVHQNHTSSPMSGLNDTNGEAVSIQSYPSFSKITYSTVYEILINSVWQGQCSWTHTPSRTDNSPSFALCICECRPRGGGEVDRAGASGVAPLPGKREPAPPSHSLVLFHMRTGEQAPTQSAH